MSEQSHLINYSNAEELAKRLTHLLAAILSLVGLVVLMVAASRTGAP